MNIPKPSFSINLIVGLLCTLASLSQTDNHHSTNQHSTKTGIKQLKEINILASDFSMDGKTDIISVSDSFRFKIDIRASTPFNQLAIKQRTEQAKYGPNPSQPYFNVRFAMPTPPAYSLVETGALTGIDSMVYRHNHSPGFEILPNGDALAVYFSVPAGKSENDSTTSFVQSRLRCGSEDWDMPELFFKTKGYNDQSGLLWNDNGKIWFFGGGRDISNLIPFRIAVSTDNGATWKFSIPLLDKKAEKFTAQPITNAFRTSDSTLFFAMDGEEAQSFLWQSTDNGQHWHDMGGRTAGRHSTIVPLDNHGKLLSIGGKNATIDGWNPQNISLDWGASWEAGTKSPFPALGTAQRPSMIRLASGRLLYVSDSYIHKGKIAPPQSWKYGNDCFVALSDDNGNTWHIKTLPVQLPHNQRFGTPTLGYTTARQAPNGLIHILTTATLPCLHYELNEAWILSDLGETETNNTEKQIINYSEHYPDGTIKSEWSARICTNGRYLLHGRSTDYYENHAIQHQVEYINGRKSGLETLWSPSGNIIWTWERNLSTNKGIWTHYWPNGKQKIQSTWNLKPEARDLKHLFFGYQAEGKTLHWDKNGILRAEFDFHNGVLNSSSEK